MVQGRPRRRLAERIAGEITLSEEPGATIRKWRTDFEVTQSTLAEALEVAPSVVSDYESGRRDSPGTGLVARVVEALLSIDERRGGERIRQFERIHSAGFESDVVYDLREYESGVSLDAFHRAIDARILRPGSGTHISGHTVIDSIETIRRLSSDDFVRLFGQSTNRALVFAGVTRGESPLVALRVVSPTPSAVVLHGIEAKEVWEHATDIARIDGYALSTTTKPLDEMLAELDRLA